VLEFDEPVDGDAEEGRALVANGYAAPADEHS
jgi:hypothetical protein